MARTASTLPVMAAHSTRSTGSAASALLPDEDYRDVPDPADHAADPVRARPEAGDPDFEPGDPF